MEEFVKGTVSSAENRCFPNISKQDTWKSSACFQLHVIRNNIQVSWHQRKEGTVELAKTPV